MYTKARHENHGRNQLHSFSFPFLFFNYEITQNSGNTFLLNIFFIYILRVIPFPHFLPRNNLSHLPSPCSPTYPLPLPCPGIPLHWSIKPSQDQGPLISLMSNKAILCCISGWSQRSLHVESLVCGLVPGSSGDTGWFMLFFVPPVGLQTPSAPQVLSLASPLGTLCSVQWMAVRIHFCICQALVEPLRTQLYQALVSKHLLASTIVSGLGNCKWDGSLDRATTF